jgi:hypothetical protein
VAVKQLFETYVYAQTLSSTTQTPFVIDPLQALHAKAHSECREIFGS